MKKFPVLVLLLLVLACGGGGPGDPDDPGGGGGPEPLPVALRLAVPVLLHDQLVLPDLLQPLPEAVAAFEAATGRDVHVEYLDDRDYSRAVGNALLGESPPDIAWMPATLGESLARSGRLLPLEPWVAERPHVLDGTEPWMEELYTHEGHLFAVPVGEKGDQSSLGYVVTTAAAERGHEPLAMELMTHLRELLPLRGRPDVALDEIALTVEDVGGGDEVSETTYFDALVRNLGDVPVENVRVLVEIDGEGVIADVLIPWIETRGREPLRVELGEREAGPYVIHAVLDPEGLVPELNRANNVEQVTWYSKASGGGGGTPTVVVPTTAPVAIDPKASVTSSTGMHPKVAFDGTNYLVVWAKQTPLNLKTFNHQLHATRISPTGTILDPGGFVVASKVTHYTNFDVVFGGSNYLVVWEEDLWGEPFPDPLSQIGAARVSVSGTLLDSTPITVENGAHATRTFTHSWPRAHYDGANFVVIYRTVINTLGDCSDPGVTCGIYARRISPTGSLLSGKATIRSLTAQFQSYHQQDTAFHAGAGLVVVQGSDTVLKKGGIYGIWFSSSGGAPVPSASPPVGIATTSSWYNWPCVSLHGKNNFLPVWSRNLTTPPKTVHYQTELASLGAPGSTPVSRGALASAKGDQYPAVAYDGIHYTIITQKRVGCLSYVGAIRMSPSGTFGPSTWFKASDLVGGVDLAYGTTNGLVVYTDFNPPSTFNGPDRSDGVWFRLIDKSK